MLRNGILLILCILSFEVFCQRDLRSGYVLQANDTVRGFIKYREGKSSLLKCSFAKKESDNLTSYTPSDIEGFGIDNRHFISLKTDSIPIFAEVVVDGLASLLRVKDFFLVKKGSEIVSLKPVSNEVYRRGVRYLVADTKYIGKLVVMFSDCPENAELTKKIQAVRPGHAPVEKPFREILTKYNSCLNSPTKFYSIAKSKKQVSFGVLAGMSLNSGSTTSYDNSFGKIDFKAIPQFTVGVFLKYRNPRISEKFQFYIEASYFNQAITGTQKTNVSQKFSYTVGYSGIRIPLGISYNFLSGSFSPYIKAAVVPVFALSKEFTKHYESPERHVNEFELRSANLSFLGAVGLEKRIQHNRALFLEVRYFTRMDILNNYVAFTFKVATTEFVVGIKL